jgi:magnesium-protoporphyrin O-methyltransferase
MTTHQPFTSRGAAVGYERRRGEIAHYFDRTAAEAWARLTSDAPVSGIRATVRRGRDRMRQTLLSWLPDDLRGRRVLDAGCGTGALAVEAARRGAHVLAIDLSPTLVQLARDRLPPELRDDQADPDAGRVDFRSGDMLDPALGIFDHVVGMDSLIHYTAADAVRVIEALAPRCNDSFVFTFAPRTPLLAAMHAAGRLFPRRDRAPSIVPVSEADLRERLGGSAALGRWQATRTDRVASGFYTSQALELVRR